MGALLRGLKGQEGRGTKGKSYIEALNLVHFEF